MRPAVSWPGPATARSPGRHHETETEVVKGNRARGRVMAVWIVVVGLEH